MPTVEIVMEATNLADLYESPLIDWSRIERRLDQGLSQAPGTGGPNRHTCWLATINTDGSPHVTGIGAIWVDGTFWFETGKSTRKGRNLARDPRCTLSVAADEFDLVVDGEATLVTDPPTVAAMAERWAAERLAGRVDDIGHRAHGRVQRTFGRPAALVRLPPRTARGHRPPHGRTRRRHPLALLVKGIGPSLALYAPDMTIDTPERKIHLRTCPLCEAMCGLEVHVEDQQVKLIRGDRDDVWSKGYVCPKGTTLGHLHHDPDRLREPMVRDGDQWREVSWEEAFARCSELLTPVIEQHGIEAVTAYVGNPLAHNMSLSRYIGILIGLSGIPMIYSAGTVDQWPKNVSSHLMYGGMWKIPVPDIQRTDFLVVMGANPHASQGSLLACPDVMGEIDGIRARGGQVIVDRPTSHGDRGTGRRMAADHTRHRRRVPARRRAGAVRRGPRARRPSRDLRRHRHGGIARRRLDA